MTETMKDEQVEERAPRIMGELAAKEAAMNGARVAYRRCPPYLRCNGCGGDGTASHPYMLGCGPHEPGWEVVQEHSP